MARETKHKKETKKIPKKKKKKTEQAERKLCTFPMYGRLSLPSREEGCMLQAAPTLATP